MPDEINNPDNDRNDPDPDHTLPIDHRVEPGESPPSPKEAFKGMMQSPSPPPPNSWQAISPEELDKLLPDYDIIALLGRGGMGAVYRATQKSLDRPVAIKVLPPELSQDLEFEARFRREAKSMARLSHPNIIQIHDFGQTEGHHFYFVMEFIDGADLHQMIRQGLVNEDTALKVVIQICEALQYAHDKGYVHRDIKPANILMTSEGVIKVGDFGLAKLIDPNQGSETEQQGLTLTGNSMGTPHYMAPEQMSGDNPIDHRADIYSLGVMLYEMLTGEIPRGAFAPPSGKIQVDVRIDDVVLKAMQEKPDLRYQAAKDIEEDVTTIQSNPRGYTMAALEKKQQAKKKTIGKKGWIGTLVGILMLGAVVASLVWRPWEELGTNGIREDNPGVEADQPSSLSPPAIALPPKLVEMKERGGSLRSWSSPDSLRPVSSIDEVEGIDDFVAVHLNNYGRWIALREDGTVRVCSNRNKRAIESLDGVKKVRATGHGFFALKNDGSLFEEISGNPEKSGFSGESFPENIADFDASFENAAFVLETGEVVFRSWSDQPSQDEEFDSAAKVWSEEINQRNDNVKVVLHDGVYGMVLRRDGTTVRFSKSPPAAAQDREDREFASIARAAHWVGLTKQGEVVTGEFVGDTSKYDLRAPKGLKKAFAIRASLGVSAAQKEDGSWVAWGDNRLGVVDKINSLGPALDISFKAHTGVVVWIEPNELSDGGNSNTSSEQSIELPPGLAAMKERGGSLRSFGTQDDGSPIVSEYPEADNLASIYNWYGHWDVITVDGNAISHEDAGKVKYTDAKKVQYGGILYNDGTLQRGNRSFSGVKDMATGNRMFLTLYEDGRLVAETTGKGVANPESLTTIEKINALEVPIRLLSNRPNGADGVAVAESGTVFCWHVDSWFEPETDGNDFVEVASLASAWVGLKKDGTLETWESPSNDQSSGSPLLNPQSPGKGYTLRTASGVAAVQLEDLVCMGNKRKKGNH